MATALRSKRKLDQLFPENAPETNFKFYEENREEFKTGDLLFFSGNHWLSGLIRWRSKSAWSHVGMVLRIDEMNRVFLVESIIENGVRLLPLSFVFKDYGGDNKPYNGRVAWTRHKFLEQNQEYALKLREFCMDNLSKQYDRKEYWRILWRSFIGRKKFFSDDKFTCAEFVLEAFKYAHIELPKERGVFISPGAFWRIKDLEMRRILI